MVRSQSAPNSQRAAAQHARFPGPPAAWALLQRIFLPAADVARGPTLLELLADPFFSVALPEPQWVRHGAAASNTCGYNLEQRGLLPICT